MTPMVKKRRHSPPSSSGEGWERATTYRPCPVCGGLDNCTVSPDANLAFCGRKKSPKKPNAGGQWPHTLNPKQRQAWLAHRKGENKKAALKKNWSAEVQRFVRQAAEGDSLATLADEFGVGTNVLKALGVGWDGRGWTFPERDGAGNVVGINLRLRNGQKRNLAGSKRGLTYADDWAKAEGPVYVVEGGSDVAAGLHAGLCVVGRASARQGAEQLAELLADVPPGREIVVLGENDQKLDGRWPGKDGAESTANRLATMLNRPVGWSMPPEGVKDLRIFFATGGECGEIAKWPLKTVEPTPSEALLPYHPFPVKDLPEPLRAFVSESAAALDCDPSYVALPALTAAAAGIGNTRRLKLKDSWHVPPMLWTTVVGESGTMKTPAAERVRKTLDKRERAAGKRYEKAYKNYKQAQDEFKEKESAYKNKKRNLPPVPPEPPKRERFVVNDTTVEALAPLLQDNPRGLLLFTDELTGWIGGFNRYSGREGADESHWLSMFSGTSITVDRKTGDPPHIFVPCASVSVTGGIQPGLLWNVLGQQKRASGLAARLLLAWPPRRPKAWSEETVSSLTDEQFESMINRLCGLEANTDENGDEIPRIVEPTTEAREVFIAYYDKHACEQVEHSGDLSAAWSKLEEYAARLALIVHCIRAVSGQAKPLVLDVESMRAGVALAEWFKREARRVYATLSESEGDRDQRELVELIFSKGGAVTARELARAIPRRFATADDAEAALAMLHKAGHGKWENIRPGPKGGRPTRRFVLTLEGVDETKTHKTYFIG